MYKWFGLVSMPRNQTKFELSPYLRARVASFDLTIEAWVRVWFHTSKWSLEGLHLHEGRIFYPLQEKRNKVGFHRETLLSKARGKEMVQDYICRTKTLHSRCDTSDEMTDEKLTNLFILSASSNISFETRKCLTFIYPKLII